jgi:hypothetical protein
MFLTATDHFSLLESITVKRCNLHVLETHHFLPFELSHNRLFVFQAFPSTFPAVCHPTSSSTFPFTSLSPALSVSFVG